MADISLIDPYSAKQESIARQRRMAQALQQQAQSPIETPQMPGVLISPYAGLAKVLQGAYGGYQEAEADKEYRALAEEARKNQAEDLAKVFGAARAPARPEIVGQEAVMDMPERIIPGQTISQYGGTLNIPGQTIPKVAYQPAIAPQPARPAGYISPELIADIKDPTARNLALAQLIKQAEPETFIKGSPGDVFYDKFGNKKFSIPAAAGTTTLSPLGKLQAERDAIFATNPKDPRLAELNAAIAKETKDVAAERLAWDQKVQAAKEEEPNYTYKEEVDSTTGVKSLIKIDNKGVASEVLNSAGTKVKTDLPPKQNPVAVKTRINGQNVTIYVDPSTLAGQKYPEQYTGIIKDLLEAQDLMKYQTDPRVIALVGSSLNKGAGLPTQEDVAKYLLDFDKTKVEMAYNNLKLNVGPSLKEAPNVLTGQSSSGAAANALPLPTDRDKKKLVNGQTYQTDQGPAKWDAALGQFVK
jgi:hypothetical protein